MYPSLMSTQSMTGERTRAVLYLRISDDAEATEHGVSAQRGTMIKLAERLGLTVVDEYTDDDASAFQDKPRAAFERLLRDMTLNVFDVVIVWVSDRLYRRHRDLARITDILQTHPVRIEQVEGGEIDLTTADGILRAQMLGSVAEFESRRKSERIALRASYRAREEGRMTFSRPITGWRWRDPCPADDRCRHSRKCAVPGQRPIPGARTGIEPDPTEGALLAKGYQIIADGGTLRSVAAMFNEAKVRPRAAAEWQAQTIRSAMLSGRNAGLITHKGEIVGRATDGQKIVDVDLWERVRRILTDPKRHTAGRPAKTLLSGIATCGRCGGPMNAAQKRDTTSAAKKNWPVYICARHQHLTRRRHLVEQAAIPLIRAWIVENAPTLAQYVEPGAGPLQRTAADEAHELRKSIDAYLSMAGSHTMKPEQVTQIVSDLNVKLEDAERRAVVAAGRPAVGAMLQADDVGAHFDALVDSDDVTQIRNVLKELVDEIVIISQQKLPEIHWKSWVREAIADESSVA